MNTESVECKVFPSLRAAREHGPGGIAYTYAVDSQRRFPEDVRSVIIVMPVRNYEAIRLMEPNEEPEIIDSDWAFLGWRTNQDRRPCWALSGTYEKPTLSPSLHWIKVWHGFLTDGYLKSC